MSLGGEEYIDGFIKNPYANKDGSFVFGMANERVQ